MGIIYIFTFPNGKKYVGQTVNVKMRYAQHRQKNPHMIVSRAIGKYGWDSIEKQELSYPENHLDRMEQEWIERLNCISPNGYNIEPGGYHGSRILSEQTRKKLGEAARGRRFSEEHKRKLSESGRGKHGGERNGMFGKKRPEHSLRMTGDLNPMFGMNHSESAKKKIAKAAKDRETRRRVLSCHT
jgi:group I intron endonuclease